MQPHCHNTHDLVSQPTNDYDVQPTEPTAITLPVLRDWFIHRLADYAGVVPSEIDSRDACTAYGIDSIAGVSLVGDLEMWLDVQLPPTLLWMHDSIEAVCQHILATLMETADAPEPCLTPALPAVDRQLDDLCEAPPGLTQLDCLTDADVDAMLHRLLAA